MKYGPFTATMLACLFLGFFASPSHAGYADGYGSAQTARHGNARHGEAVARYGGSVAPSRRETGNLVASNGRAAKVSGVALPHFQCLIAFLDNAGYRIDFMTGFAARPGNPSAHPTGNAIDVNQTGRGRVTRAFPAGTDAAARRCGLTPGSEFGDTGHFEMARKYGYVFPSGWRYARQ